MRRVWKALVLFLLIISPLSCGKKEQLKELTVYSTLLEEEILLFLEGFHKEYPDIQVNFIRDSSGVMAAKFEAEKKNPAADVLWAVPTAGFLNNQDYFLPYDYKTENIDGKFIDQGSAKPRWVGLSAWMSAVTFNNALGREKSLPVPVSYQDLLDPVYRDEIIMPDPASSGTGYLAVSAWIQLMGEDAAWEYMDGLHKNIKMYVHSGGAPTRMAAQGETALGIGVEYESIAAEKKNFPVTTVFPAEGIGWEMEIVAIVKKEKIKDEAKILAAWALSKNAMEYYAKARGFVTDNRINSTLAGYPDDIREKMIENDLLWATENRDRILAKWKERYGTGE
ncbi:MAG: extracellular solute-binding protein [Fusobacteriaceae bacterium]|jgi:iron(III) transport system substrate-binding protein|nr:extracellular solute-binding protein [Fusobacteriaceae bacterium]